MSHPAYLIKTTKGRLNTLAEKLFEEIGESGEALVPISSQRAILPTYAASQITKLHPRENIQHLLRTWGARQVAPITRAEIRELVTWRDPDELVMPRLKNKRPLIENGYDWHLERTNIVDAWSLLGGPDAIDWGYDVVIGQIDTGYTENPALGWEEGQSSCVLTDRDKNVFTDEIESQDEWDLNRRVNRDPLSARDPISGPNGGHGTRTASILTGSDKSDVAKLDPNNPDGQSGLIGYFGAAPRVPYIPVRLSNSVWINNVGGEALADAIDHLVEEGVKVITMSMGIGLPAVLLEETEQAIIRAYRAGVIYCSAAGNIIDKVVAPANHPCTICVGGSTPADLPWSGSSFGGSVTICAPSWPIRRANTTKKHTFNYGYGDGTSYATPQVSGTAAMWLLKHKDKLDSAYPEPWQKVEAFRTLLKNTARVPDHGWDKSHYGAGILDAHALLSANLPNRDELSRMDLP